jgi:hypothetical protein
MFARVIIAQTRATNQLIIFLYNLQPFGRKF